MIGLIGGIFMEYNIAICDDEKIFREIIKDNIKLVYNKIKNKANVDEFSSGEILICEVKENPQKYDIYFLDIIMKNINGIDIAKVIRSYNPLAIIIFITSSTKHVFEGYDAGAFNYLLKPIDENKFNEVFFNAINIIELREKEFFVCKYKSTIAKILLRDIEFFESEKRVVKIHTKDKEYIFYGKLSDVEEGLNKKSFIRCHKSYIVNITKIKELDKMILLLESGKEIPISKTYLENTKKGFIEYLGEWW